MHILEVQLVVALHQAEVHPKATQDLAEVEPMMALYHVEAQPTVAMLLAGVVVMSLAVAPRVATKYLLAANQPRVHQAVTM